MTDSRGFPRSKDDFAADERIAWDSVAKKWILEDGNGDEWDFIEETGKWLLAVDEVQVAQQQAAYAVPGVDDTEDAQVAIAAKKRKLLEAAKDEQPTKKVKPDKPTTAIYVTSLPLNVTVEEIKETFSKYGIIAEEVDTNKPRIKLYTDEDGNPKGDALIVYFRPESVQLAIQMMDDTDFRWGEKGPNGRMTVAVADMSYKKQVNTGDGKKVAPVKGAKGRGSAKQKIIEKTERLNQRLANWSDDEDERPVVKKASRWDKFVVLKHMFTVEGLAKEIKGDPKEMEKFKDEVKGECVKFGEVFGVYVYDLEEEGVITVRFNEAEAATECARKLNGKPFDKRIVAASIADGSERFKKTKYIEESDSEEEKRLNSFGAILEKD